MTVNKLKPCPFCGIDAHVEQIGGRYTAGCVTLDCMGYARSGKLFNDQTKAIEAWNRREAYKEQAKARDEFMGVVYDELSDDADNCRANRIIDAADEYAESLM